MTSGGVTRDDRRETREVSRPLSQAPKERRFAEGGHLGRYVVLEEVGAGGMGRVYRAYDPKLSREVALKLIRFRSSSPRAREQAEARIVREARAMAALSHPNVLQVFDVEKAGGSVFLVMEYVEGQSLRRWLRRKHRSHQEVVTMFCEAGRGLAAAHRAGIVHRDFKPSNVLIGDDGRIRVMDFGVARGEPGSGLWSRSSSSGSLDGEAEVQAEIDVEEEPLTREGAILGTPPYMAPEQQSGGEVSPRSDVYAFCVSLYEGLYGIRPFRARRAATLLEAKRSGLLEPPPDARVPKRLWSIIERGLAPEPRHRFASMPELLTALQDDPEGRRRRWLAWGALAAVVAGGSAGGAHVWARWADQCSGGAQRLEGVWDEHEALELRSAFLQSQQVMAEETWTRVEAALDRRAAAWVRAQRDACEATHIRKEQSPEVLDLRSVCLERNLRGLGALVGALSREVDVEVLQRAVEAIDSLPSVARCSDVDRLRRSRDVPDDPQLVQGVEDIRNQLYEVDAMAATGRYEAAHELAEALRVRADELQFEPLRAQALLREGQLERELASYEAARDDLLHAYRAAIASHADEVTWAAAASLLSLTGHDLERHEDAEQWAQRARAWARRLGGGVPYDSRIAAHVGVLRWRQGRLEEAMVQFERARQLLEDHPEDHGLEIAAAIANSASVASELGRHEDAERWQARVLESYMLLLGPDHPEVATALNTYGSIFHLQGELEEAQSHYRRAVEIRERTLGAAHPDTAALYNNLASVSLEMGQHDRARELASEALDRLGRGLPAQHPHLAAAHANLGAALLAQGELEEASDHYRRALEIRRAAFGDEHPALAGNYIDIGNIYLERRDYDQAEASYRQALELLTRAHGPDHGTVAIPLGNLAEVHRAKGEAAASLEAARRAYAISRAHLPPDSPDLAASEVQLARSLIAADRSDEAVDLLELARERVGSTKFDPRRRSEIAFALAQASWNTDGGRSRDRARGLAAEALGLAQAAGPGADELQSEIRAWMSEHRTRSAPETKEGTP